MKTIKGKDLVIKLGDRTIYHAQSHEFTSNTEYEEWETKDTDGKQYELSGVTGTATANGIACVSEANDQGSYDTPSLLDAQLSGQPLPLTLNIESKVYTTTAWIESVSITGEVAKKSTYSASFRTNALKLQTATPTSEE